MNDKISGCNAELVRKILYNLSIDVLPKNYVLLVGSALKDPKPRDYDVIWVSKDNQEIKKTVDSIAVNFDKLNLNFDVGKISVLFMTTLKLEYLDNILSFHFVSEDVLNKAINLCEELDTYTSINLFNFDFCAPRIVRLWSQESSFLLGDINSYKLMLENIKSINVPWEKAVSYTKSRLKNCISYAREKNWQSSQMGLFLLVGEIINFIMLLVYFENHSFVGSKKKIDSDLNKSELGCKVIRLCKQLSNSISNYESLLLIFKEIELILL